MAEVEGHQRHHHVELELAAGGGGGDGGVEADHLVADHGQHLGHGRVDLARHDRRAGLDRRQPQLAEPGGRAAAEQPHVAADAQQLDRRAAQRAGEGHEGAERLHGAGEAARRRERHAGELRQLVDHQLPVARVGVDAGAHRGAADAEQRELRQRRRAPARRRRAAWPPSPPPPARAGWAWRPSGGSAPT